MDRRDGSLPSEVLGGETGLGAILALFFVWDLLNPTKFASA